MENNRSRKKAGGRVGVHRPPPVKLPLPFETAVEGLLAVKARKKKKPAAKKATGRAKKK